MLEEFSIHEYAADSHCLLDDLACFHDFVIIISNLIFLYLCTCIYCMSDS